MNEGQGGIVGSGALDGAGSVDSGFGTFGNTPSMGGATVVGGSNNVPVQQPIASVAFTNNSTTGGDIFLDSSKQEKSWKKWAIGMIVVAVVLIIGIVLFKVLWTRSAEDVRDTYWSYVNYLVRREESKEAFSGWEDSDAVVKEAFRNHDEAYFDGLKDAFDRFYDVFKRGPKDMRASLDETVQELNEAVSFAVGLNEVGILDKDALVDDFENGLDLLENEKNKLAKLSGLSDLAQGYVEKRLSFVEVFSKYLKMSSVAGCSLSGDVDTVCLFFRDISLEEINEVSGANDIWYETTRSERDVISRLILYSWKIDNIYMEEEYAQEN